jgi:PepSY-associated TM region
MPSSTQSAATLASERPSIGRQLLRWLILGHRYLGMVLGILMALWCLSGIVMIYVPFPQLVESERLAALSPIDWRGCCTTGMPTASLAEFQMEMVGETRVLRLSGDEGTYRLVDASTGSLLDSLDPALARSAVATFARSRATSVAGSTYQSITRDQWTVGGFARDRPLHWFELHDADGTELYVSSKSGKIIQLTTRSQRFWSWLGAVPHWLYPTILRQHPEAWSQVVIWTSLIGSVMALTGVYLGIHQWRRGRGGATSPYRGLMYWHHVPGLIFGIFALTWAVSGCLSMNPWGLLETQSMRDDVDKLRGDTFTAAEAADALAIISRQTPQLVSLRSSPLDGKLFLIGTRADGTRIRYAGDGMLAPLTDEEINAASHRLAGAEGARWERLTTEDTYHYNVGRRIEALPVIRVTIGGDYYYLDNVTAELVDKADAGGRAYRWWHSGLHRLDFSPFLRTTIGRTLVLLPLLLGATFVTVTGAYLGVRRWKRSSAG